MSSESEDDEDYQDKEAKRVLFKIIELIDPNYNLMNYENLLTEIKHLVEENKRLREEKKITEHVRMDIHRPRLAFDEENECRRCENRQYSDLERRFNLQGSWN